MAAAPTIHQFGWLSTVARGPGESSSQLLRLDFVVGRAGFDLTAAQHWSHQHRFYTRMSFRRCGPETGLDSISFLFENSLSYLTNSMPGKAGFGS